MNTSLINPHELINVTPKGVQAKPASCRVLCPYYSVGSGFVGDFQGKHPRVAFMFPHPTGDEAINRMFVAGRGGDNFLSTYITPLGYDREDCIFSGAMRCRPKGDGGKAAKWGTVLTGPHAKNTYQACRHHDSEVLATWSPNCVVLTLPLASVYNEPAFTRLVQTDIKKAFQLAGRGYRPLVLMGNEAAELFTPFIKGNGGVKTWRGHWQEMETYPFAKGYKPPKLAPGFMPAGYIK